MKEIIISVIGTTWEGAKASYQATFDSVPDDVPSSFGDFETVDDWRMVETSVETRQLNVTTSQTISTTTVLTDWENEENGLAFEDNYR